MSPLLMSDLFLASCHVLVFSILLLILKPLLRKHMDSIRLGAIWSLLYTGFILFESGRSSADALFRIPWPTPQISSSIAAFDQAAGIDWFAAIRLIWIVGAVGSALILFISYRMFLSRIQLDEQPCPASLDSLADELYSELLNEIYFQTYKSLSEEKREKKIRHALQKAKARPRIVISGVADGPALPLFTSRFILLDRTDYPADELKWILRHAFLRSFSGVLEHHIDALIAWIALWFNPANWFLYRGSRAAAASKYDELLLEDKTPEDQAAYLRMLKSLTTDQTESLHFVRIGGSEQQIHDRVKRITRQEEPFISDHGLSLIVAMIFFLISPQIVQLDTRFPVTEQSVFCVLGANEKQFLDTATKALTSFPWKKTGCCTALRITAPVLSMSIPFLTSPFTIRQMHLPNIWNPAFSA